MKSETREAREERNGTYADTDAMHEEDPVEEKTTTSTLSGPKGDKDKLDYWFAKVLEYEASIQNDQPAFRTTRWRKKQSSKQDIDEYSHRNHKNFSLEKIKDRIKHTEKVFSNYLNKWGSRWAKPAIKEEIVSALKAQIDNTTS